MPQNDQRHRPAGIRSVIKILLIVLVTIAVTLLFIRSSQPVMAKIPGWTEDDVHHSNDGKQSTQDQRDNNFSVGTTISTLKATPAFDLGVVWPESTLIDIKDRSLKNRSVNGSPSQLTVVNARENHYVVEPSIAHQDEPIKRNWYPANHRNDNDISIDDDEDNQSLDRVATVTGSYQDSQTNNYDRSNIDNKMMIGPDESTGYHHSYDLTYNVGDYGYNKQIIGPTNENRYVGDAVGAVLQSAYPPAYGTHPSFPGSQLYTDQQPPTVNYLPSNVNYLPPITNYVPPSTGYAPPSTNLIPPSTNYVPPKPSYSPPITTFQPPRSTATTYLSPGPQHTMVLPSKPSMIAVDWRAVGILAIVKLVLVKLKAFGIISVLLFLLFKLKLLLMTVFFKTLLLLKFIKFFKIFVLPLFVLPILPILTTLLYPMLSSVSGWVTNMVMGSNNTSTVTPPIPSMPSMPNMPSMLPTSNPPGSLFFRPSTSAPAVAGQLFIPSINSRRSQAFKIEDVNLPNERHQLESFEALDVFRKLLDSEKCVERIACRMAMAKKAEIVPTWIDWFVSDVSKLIPNEKFELYSKTYENVEKEIINNFQISNDWATWCLEHYDCKSNNATNTTDKEH